MVGGDICGDSVAFKPLCILTIPYLPYIPYIHTIPYMHTYHMDGSHMVRYGKYGKYGMYVCMHKYA